jgi:hypothetical protein
MNTLEHRIAAATRAAAETVTPASVPPLSLPAGRARGTWRWRRLAPVMAAVAVAAIVLTIVAVRGVLSTRTAAPTRPATSSAVAEYVRSGQIPAFYVTLTPPGYLYTRQAVAVVHATATGQTLATIKPPAGWTVVAATVAADDRTVVLDEEPWTAKSRAGLGSGTLMLARLSDSGQIRSVMPLGLTVPGGASLNGLALSPDGRRIALVTRASQNSPTLIRVTVVTLAGGASRIWSATTFPIGFGLAAYDNLAVSWTADQTELAFNWQNGQTAGLRLLDLNSAGSSLLGDSTVAVPLSPQAGPGGTLVTWRGDAIITADGTTVVVAAPSISRVTATGQSRVTTGFAEFSARTGALTRVLWSSPVGHNGPNPAEVLWSDRTGRVLIGTIESGGRWRVGVISGNTFTPLNLTWPEGTNEYTAW